MSYYDRAQSILNRAFREDCPLAVYLAAGSVRTAKLDSRELRELQEHRPEAIVGVYRSDADPEQLEADIIYTEASL